MEATQKGENCLLRRALKQGGNTSLDKSKAAGAKPTPPPSDGIRAWSSPSYHTRSLPAMFTPSPDTPLASEAALRNYASSLRTLSSRAFAEEWSMKELHEEVSRLQLRLRAQTEQVEIAGTVISSMGARIDELCSRLSETEARLSATEAEKEAWMAKSTAMEERLKRVEEVVAVPVVPEDGVDSMISTGLAESIGKSSDVRGEDGHSTGDEQQLEVDTVSRASEEVLEEEEDRTMEVGSGNIHLMAMQQAGSALVKNKLNDASTMEEEVTLIHQDLLPHAVALARHEHGHQVLQVLLEKCTDEEARWISEMLAPHVDKLATEVYGLHVVLTALEFLPDRAIGRFVGLLELEIKRVAFDKRGSQVAVKLLERVGTEEAQSIVQLVIAFPTVFAYQEHGHRLVSFLLENGRKKEVEQIALELCSDVGALSEDEHGSKVVQKVPEYAPKATTEKMIEKIIKKASVLRTDAHGCGVVRAAFAHGTDEHKKRFRRQLLGMGARELARELMDSNGCGVAKDFLEECDQSDKDRLKKLIEEFIPTLRDNEHSRAVVAILDEPASSTD